MKSENQKLKIIYLIEILTKYTDEEHLLNASQIIEKLKLYGVEAERKSIYSDINLLAENGIIDVERVAGRNGGVHVLGRKFELAELKMLADAVQASKFITNKQCTALIKKLSDFISVYDESKLKRSVYIHDRVQEKDKNAYYLIDAIHAAISENKAITFQLTEISLSKKHVKRHDGKVYEVSPYALVWRDEYYYLIAYNHESKAIRHYRVDKMENLHQIKQSRIGKDVFDEISLSSYLGNVFEMFGGREYLVRFWCEKHLAGAMLDRFGSEIKISEYDDHFEFYAPVQISVRFFGWIFGFAGAVRILSPENVVKEYKIQLQKVANSL